MGISEKLAELEAEYAKTQKNKRTEGHLGILKAKMAKLRREIIDGGSRGGAGAGSGTSGFDVRKAGNATVVFIGLPSVGKSTLLNALTGSKSKTAEYAFTTLSCIPGIMRHKGAQIQLLDLPGVIAGASSGKGRGREVLAVARNADLVLLILDVFDPNCRDKLVAELDNMGVRLDSEPADIAIEHASRGGLDIVFAKRQTHGLDAKVVTGILKEYGIFNGSVVVRQDATVDQLIDKLAGNRRYAPSLTVMNKIDLVQKDYLKQIKYSFIPISADRGQNIERLKDEIYSKLRMIRVYTKSRFEDADDEPLIVKEGTTVIAACGQIHRDLKDNFKSARVWGPSAKHPGQKVGADHVLKDGDVFKVETR
jgi:small GTP-binding protein